MSGTKSAAERGASTTRPKRSSKTHVVSVRFPEVELRQLQALATVLDVSPNAIIREAVDAFIVRKIKSAEYDKLKQQHLDRLREHERLLAARLDAAQD